MRGEITQLQVFIWSPFFMENPYQALYNILCSWLLGTVVNLWVSTAQQVFIVCVCVCVCVCVHACVFGVECSGGSSYRGDVRLLLKLWKTYLFSLLFSWHRKQTGQLFIYLTNSKSTVFQAFFPRRENMAMNRTKSIFFSFIGDYLLVVNNNIQRRWLKLSRKK